MTRTELEKHLKNKTPEQQKALRYIYDLYPSDEAFMDWAVGKDINFSDLMTGLEYYAQDHLGHVTKKNAQGIGCNKSIDGYYLEYTNKNSVYHIKPEETSRLIHVYKFRGGTLVFDTDTQEDYHPAYSPREMLTYLKS